MLKLKPPTHRIDGAAVFIYRGDPAWDVARIIAECDALEARALCEAQAAAVEALGPDATAEDAEAARAGVDLSDAERRIARERHPFERYQQGRTRFQLDAPDHAPDGSPCTVRGYLTGPATEFSLCRLKRVAYQAVDELSHSLSAKLTECARLGLRGIRSADYEWQAEPAQAKVPDDVLEALHVCDPVLTFAIGMAVLHLSRGLNTDELFR